MQCEFYQFNQDFVHSLKESNKKPLTKIKRGKALLEIGVTLHLILCPFYNPSF